MEQVPQTEKPKRETFKTTILRILKDLNKPIPRLELVEMAIKQNPPKSLKPQWVYNDICRKLKKDGNIYIADERRLEKQVVSLKPIPKEERPQQKK